MKKWKYWKNTWCYNHHPTILEIKIMLIIKAIETSVTDGVGTAESDSVTDNVASDDKDNQW